ncbi:MAG: 2Fe-2S iron-sulfur cluster-binding protein, partial [Paracoccaceae bacterium]
LWVPEDKSLSDVLQENGISVDVKCSDGICGVCKCGVVSGNVEHRDFVLSDAQRKTEIVTCQSRAAEGCQEITLDL